MLRSYWPRTQHASSAAPPPAPSVDAFTPLRLHGRVAKRGPVVGLSQLAALYEGQDNPSPQLAVQLYYPESWRDARLRGGRPEPPGRLCAVMWNDDLKVQLRTGSALFLFAVSHIDMAKQWRRSSRPTGCMAPASVAAARAPAGWLQRLCKAARLLPRHFKWGASPAGCTSFQLRWAQAVKAAH
jgi:hypothetical protein